MALEALPPQHDAIDEFLQKRFRGAKPDPKELKRATDALLRRGHSWSDIRSALERYVPEDELPGEGQIERNFRKWVKRSG